MSDIDLQVIENDDDLEKTLVRIDKLWGAKIGTPQGSELDVLIRLVKNYEASAYPMLNELKGNDVRLKSQ